MRWVRSCVQVGRRHLPTLQRRRIGDARLRRALQQMWNRTADAGVRHEARHALGPGKYVDAVRLRENGVAGGDVEPAGAGAAPHNE